MFGLAVLILMIGLVSGAHLNPVVTAADWLLALPDGRRLPHRTCPRQDRGPLRRVHGRRTGQLVRLMSCRGPLWGDMARTGRARERGPAFGRSRPSMWTTAPHHAAENPPFTANRLAFRVGAGSGPGDPGLGWAERVRRVGPRQLTPRHNLRGEAHLPCRTTLSPTGAVRQRWLRYFRARRWASPYILSTVGLRLVASVSPPTGGWPCR